jgi:hypothetical protein
MLPTLLILLLLALTTAAVLTVQLRRRHMQYWLPSFLSQEARRLTTPRPRTPIHVLLCIADHFEPTPGPEGTEAVAHWTRDYPTLLGNFRDSDGRTPRHTFFYPLDMYDEAHVDAIAHLCAQGFGEVEVHLHHDNDTATSLARRLNQGLDLLANRHNLLGRWPDGRPAYGFIHGNWALNNSRPDGRWCGVNDELSVLVSTGCFADFTLPSAPSPTQTRIINSIYYATSHPDCSKSHDHGTPLASAPQPNASLMLIQGPLRLHRRGLRPIVENACLQHSQPPTMDRLNQWIKAGIHVPTRPDLVFIKLHTHGSTPANRTVLLGDPMVHFHQDLAARAASDPSFKFHYVTAREMYNIAKAAESGSTLSVAELLDFQILPPRPNNTSNFLPITRKSAPVASQVGR